MCISSPTARVMEPSETRNETTEQVMWQRIVETRVQECMSLGDALFLSIFRDFETTLTDRTLFAQTLADLLHQHIQIFTGRDTAVTRVSARRQSWTLVQGVFSKIESVKHNGVDALLQSRNVPAGAVVSTEATPPPQTISTPAEPERPATRRVESNFSETTLSTPVRAATRTSESNSRSETAPIDRTAPVTSSNMLAVGAVHPLATPVAAAEASTAAQVATRLTDLPLSTPRKKPVTRAGSNQLAQVTVVGNAVPFSPIESSQQRKRKNAPEQESSDAPAQTATSLPAHAPIANDSRLGFGTKASSQTNRTNWGTGPVNNSDDELQRHKQAMLDRLYQRKQEKQVDDNTKWPRTARSEVERGRDRRTPEDNGKAKQRPEKSSLPKVSVDSNADEGYGDAVLPPAQKAMFDNQRATAARPGLSTKYTEMNDNARNDTHDVHSRSDRPDFIRRYDDNQAEVASDMSMSDVSAASRTRDRESSSNHHRPRHRYSGEQSSSSNIQQEFVTCKRRDVLVCWGKRAANWEGNVYFMRQMNHYCSRSKLEINEWMDDLICKAMRDVELDGGRFLREYNSSPSASLLNDKWLLLDRPEALDCLRNMLNDNPEFAWSPSHERHQAVTVNTETPRTKVVSGQKDHSDNFEKMEHTVYWRCRHCQKLILFRHLESHSIECQIRRSEVTSEQMKYEAYFDKVTNTNYWRCRACLKACIQAPHLKSHFKKCRGAGLSGHLSAPLVDPISPPSVADPLSQPLPATRRSSEPRDDGRQTSAFAQSETRRPHDARDDQGSRVTAREASPKKTVAHDVSKIDQRVDPGTPNVSKTSHMAKMNQVLKNVTFPVREDRKDKATGLIPFARTQKGRPGTNVTVDIRAYDDAPGVKRRLSEWDPFWMNLNMVYVGVTSKVDSTVPPCDLINTAAEYYLPYPLNEKVPNSGLKWNQKRTAKVWRDGDVALILRMLPTNPRAYKTKRSDCHLWPKGTFVQVNGNPVEIAQRVQQEHNDVEWKGMSGELDLTPLLATRERNRVHVCCYDEQEFIYAVFCCKYRSATTLFQTLTERTNPEKLPWLSREASIRKATQFASQQMTISLDCDNDEQQSGDELGKFVFSLSCPYTKSILTYPVRGASCKHFQCHDLNSYLSCNAHVTGSRWRCASCEEFVSVQSLEVCGFTSDLLKEFKRVLSPTRDRIQVNADGSYMLLEERKERMKRRSMNGTSNSNAKAAGVVVELIE